VYVLLKEGFGVEEGLMTDDSFVHGDTEKRSTDLPGRTGRAGARAAINIIPLDYRRGGAPSGSFLPEVKGS